MKRFERILVCIDRSKYDQRLLSYAGIISRYAKSKTILMLHVYDDVLSSARATAAKTSAPSSEATTETLQSLATESFMGHGTEEVRCAIATGSTLVETLRFAHEEDADLIILGRRFGAVDENDQEAVLARRITRKATCSVLVLPEDHRARLDPILVPVRNSECSANALDVACGIASITNAAVTALNIYQVHAGYSRVGTDLDEHQELLESAAHHECELLLKQVDTHGVNVACACTPDLRAQPVPIILNSIETGSAALIVIGARGRTGAAGVLLGNITEQLIKESPAPVLAVKKKGECLSVLQALLTLAAGG